MKIGLIGFGEWARTAHVPVLKTLDDVEIAAVAARSQATRERARALLGDTVRTTPDYRELLAFPDIEAVTVAVPNAMHREVALAALKAGKHLFLELPVALTPQDVTAVLEAAESGDRVVQLDFELRYMPVCGALQEIVGGGALGRPLSATIELRCGWGYGGGGFHEPTARDGFYVWLGAWYLDVLDLLLGGPLPTRAQVGGGRAMSGPMLDHGHAVLEYDNGTVGMFTHTLISTRPEVSVTAGLLCERGELTADLSSGAITEYLPKGQVRQTNHPPKQPIYGWAGMRESIEGFVAAIRTGAPVKGNVQVARRVHKAVFACHEADQKARR
jgi:predicted dehydrogenase